MTRNRVFLGVTLLLFSAGWAANHFASMIAVLRQQEGVSSVLANGAFGIYALGLLPCLLAGGMLADRFGARPIVLSGGVIAALGNLSLLLWHTGSNLLIGRFIVGLGVGLAVSAGTSWAGRLRGASGSTLAGIILTLGFMIGPIASGLLAEVTPAGAIIKLPFALSAVLSLAAVGASIFLGDEPGQRVAKKSGTPAEASMRKALFVALPMALWVFSCITTAIIILADRAASHFPNAILLPGIGAFLAFSAGLIAQWLGRKFNWGRASGLAGAIFATCGYALAAVGGLDVSVPIFISAALIFGTAYGLCLREGLLGIETYTPAHRRGTAIGIYYVFTYVGFAFPVLFDALLPHLGAIIPLIIIACCAAASAFIRAAQIKRGYI